MPQPCARSLALRRLLKSRRIPIRTEYLRITGPNYGVPVAYWRLQQLPGDFVCQERDDVQTAQAGQMANGSAFLNELNRRWNEKVTAGTLKPEDVLTIAGCKPQSSSNGRCSKLADLSGDDLVV